MPQDPFYSTKKYRQWRDDVLKRAGYRCEECRRYGRTNKNGLPPEATTAHHKKHREEFPELQYDLENGQALCAKCHNKKHPEKGGRYWKPKEK